MLKELSEDLSRIKNTQSETKYTLIEIKNNLQRYNNRADEAKNQINELEHEEQRHLIHIARRKKNTKNRG